MKKTLLITVMCLAGYVAAAPQCPPVIKVGFYDSGLLFNDGKGIDQDVINELKQRTGCNLVGGVYPRAKIWKDIESGEMAMSVSGIQNPARDQFAWFANYLSTKNVSIVPKKISKNIQSFNDFLNDKSLQWGVIRAFKHGETQDQFLAQLRKQNRIIEATNAEQLFELLKAGRIQGMFSQSPMYGYYIPKLGMSQLVSTQDWTPMEKSISLGLILSKKHFSASEAAQWQSIINTMNIDGTMLRILKQHLPDFEVKKALYIPQQ